MKHGVTIVSSAVLLGGMLLALPAAAGDSLLYVVEGDTLVFTNVPSAGDARPVPGFEPAERELADSARLPTTIYDPFIDRVASELGLSPSLIKAVALVESDLDPHAVSPKGAQGLMQLMPATARHYGVQDAFDPLQNLRAGATHLRRLVDEFDGDLRLALAAYNAGSGAVRRHGGVPDYRETVDYVRRVQERLGRTDPGVSRGPAAIPVSGDVQMVQRADGSFELSN